MCSTSRSLRTCDVSLGLLTLSAPEAGEFVELIPLYIRTWLKLLSGIEFNRGKICQLSRKSAYLVQCLITEVTARRKRLSCPPPMTLVALMAVRRR